MSLYSVAILKRPPATADGDVPMDEIVYGPATVQGARHEDASQIANRVIAKAAAEGKLPDGWSSRHYVAGISYSVFT